MSHEEPPPGWSAQQPPVSDEGFAGTRPAEPPPAPPTAPAAPEPGSAPVPAATGGWGPPPVPPPALPPGWRPPAADQPGILPLRPVGIGDIYSASFALIKPAWRALLPAVALAAALAFSARLGTLLLIRALGLAQRLADLQHVVDEATAVGAPVPATTWHDLLTVLAQTMAIWTIGLVVIGLVQLIVVAAVVHATGQAVLGRPVTVDGVWQSVRRHLVGLIAASILVDLGVALGALLCLVPGLIVGVLWALTSSALVLEQCGPVDAMRRSWRLVRTAWWRVLGIVVLTGLVAAAVSTVVTAPFTALATIGTLDTSTTPLQSLAPVDGAVIVGQAVGTVVSIAVVAPFVVAVVTILYLDLRIRTENLGPTLTATAQRDRAGTRSA
jgi:hypothetical protein